MNTLPPGGGPHNPHPVPDAVLPPPALGETWVPGAPATPQGGPGGPAEQAGPGGPRPGQNARRRARRWRTFWIVLLIIALVAGSVITWFATGPSRERARLAEQVATDINGVLDGDEQAGHRLVDSTGAQELEGEVISLLSREGAEAALGAPITVSVDASEVKLGKFDTVVTATVKGSRTSARLEVWLQRDEDTTKPSDPRNPRYTDDWTVQPLRFPVITIKPEGPARPRTIGFNGLTRDFPQNAAAAQLLTWPGDTSKLSLGGNEFVSWGETDLGRIPSTSLSRSSRSVNFDWSPRISYSDKARAAAEKAGGAWLARQATARAQSPTSYAPEGGGLMFDFELPVTGNAEEAVRNLKGAVIAAPALSFGPLRGDPQPEGPFVATLANARLKFTGEYLDGKTWLPFTRYLTISAQVDLDTDFAAVTRGVFK